MPRETMTRNTLYRNLLKIFRNLPDVILRYEWTEWLWYKKHYDVRVIIISLLEYDVYISDRKKGKIKVFESRTAEQVAKIMKKHFGK